MTPVLPVQSGLTPRATHVLAAASDTFAQMCDTHGYTRCPEHGIDHTGKTSRSIVINCALHAHTGNDQYLERAVNTALNIVARVAPDPAANDAWIFFPGLHDYRNNSTNIIDAGECVDALATLLLHSSDSLALGNRTLIEEAIQRCCDTYLVNNVTAKPIVNQRLWGAMGLATASAALGEPAWAKSALVSVQRSLGEMRADGSFAYVNDSSVLDEGDGIGDLTVYYHSRCVGFARHVLRHLNAEPDFEQQLRAGADFLTVILRPDGVKPLGLEGKRWFWNSDAEVGSSAYDAYVLASDGRESLLPLAGWAAAQSAAAMGKSGLVDATPGSSAFVCRMFHTADLAWLARAHASAPLNDTPNSPARIHKTSTTHACQAGVVRLNSQHTCAIIRTHKQPANRLVGGRIGGGGLIYVGKAADAWCNRLKFRSEPSEPEATWCAAGNTLLMAMVLVVKDSATQEGRFLLHIARSHLRAGRWMHALGLIWRQFGPPIWRARQRWSSMHATESDIRVDDDSIEISSHIANADAQVNMAAVTHRVYRISETSIAVRDELQTSRFVHDVQYRLPTAAADVTIEYPGGWKRRRNLLQFGVVEPGAKVCVVYRI